MPSPAICFRLGLSNVHTSPSSSCSHPPLSSRTLFASLHLLKAGNNGWRNRCKPSSISRGELFLSSPFRVGSFLPNSDTAAGREEAVSSPSSNLNFKNTLNSVEVAGRISLEPFRGKSGCVSFSGLTYQFFESRKLVSSPFGDEKGSLIWIVAPVALISSLLLPQFFINNIAAAFLKKKIIADIVASLSSEVIFYIGLASFLMIMDRVQRPYIDFSSKQWSLITGLQGHLSSAFIVMGVKVVAPLLGAYVVWPVVGLPAVVAVLPFVLGCAVQFAVELFLQRRGSSCWHVLPIIFEVYRLYQLNKGAYFLERMLFSMKNARMTMTAVERANALVSMVVLLQVLAVACLWSLSTFLLRLFPSRPVAGNY
ncbi:hypothetical protein HPP92_018223 [Vanilla planifolia]|uniref:Uncharacterized protein n=1 Tax=Vanilla planifolia TaxID=51239 RepID=A0A835QDM0_VANPL|nr:hypothetical protein HPP92_018817 [Vanilla planifolia]KAG0468895.1 hypothetical protein HPP92_018223 [Vanilla planifolia]